MSNECQVFLSKIRLRDKIKHLLHSFSTWWTIDAFYRWNSLSQRLSRFCSIFELICSLSINMVVCPLLNCRCCTQVMLTCRWLMPGRFVGITIPKSPTNLSYCVDLWNWHGVHYIDRYLIIRRGSSPKEHLDDVINPNSGEVMIADNSWEQQSCHHCIRSRYKSISKIAFLWNSNGTATRQAHLLRPPAQ